MKISAVPPLVSSVTVPTQQSTNRDDPPLQAVQNSELPITDINETKEPEATQPLSPQFAELAKRRRALQLKERALVEKEKALAAQTTGSGAIDPARLKSETLKVLQEAGALNDQFYNEMTEFLIGNGGESSDAKLKAMEERFEKKLAERDAQFEKQALTAIERDVGNILAQTDKYKLVKAQEALPQVVEHIKVTHDEKGYLMDFDKALQDVEDWLRKDYDRVKSFYEPPTPPAQPQPQQQPGMRTLTNRDTASIALSRRARALAAWNNK